MAPRVHLVLLCALASCSAGDVVPLREFQSKSREVDSLRAVIDELENGAPRLFAKAKAAMAERNYVAATSAAAQLTAKFPGSAEALEVSTIASAAVAGSAAEAAARQRETERALAGMVKKRDEMRSLTIWRDRAAPAYVDSRSWVGAYIMHPDGRPPYLRMAIYYKSSEWLFIERYLFKVDGRDHRFIPESYGTEAIERDNGYGGIWEWWDVPAEGERLAFLLGLADAAVATMRYEGKQYYRDRTISAAERASLKRTIVAFESLSAGSR